MWLYFITFSWGYVRGNLLCFNSVLEKYCSCRFNGEINFVLHVYLYFLE